MKNNYDKYTLEDLNVEIARTQAILEGRNFYANTVDKDEPVGHNGLPTNLLFEERLYYRDRAFLQLEGKDNGLLDRWNTILEYGKVDSSGQPVYPSESFLKQFTSTEKDVFALNFVVDAFEEMATWLEEYLYKAGYSLPEKARGGSAIIPMTVSRAWESVTLLYNDHVKEMYRVFTNGFLDNKHSRILTFEHFVEQFMEFCRLIAPSTPVTLSSFVESKFCPLHINGITIEIAKDSYDDDQVKFDTFLNHGHFELYRYAAQLHGFMIDKNIPWRLIANLNHPKMRAGANSQILLGVEPTIKNMMTTAYRPAQGLDIFLLKFHLPSFYNSYIKFMPVVDTPTLNYCPSSGTTLKNNQSFRSPINAFTSKGALDQNSHYYQEYHDKYWINFYYEIKHLENNDKLPKHELLQKTHKIMNYYDSFGLIKTIEKINSEVRLQRAKNNLKRGFITKAPASIIIDNELNTSSHHASSGTPYTLELEDVNVTTGEVVSTTPVSNGTGGPPGTVPGGGGY